MKRPSPGVRSMKRFPKGRVAASLWVVVFLSCSGSKGPFASGVSVSPSALTLEAGAQATFAASVGGSPQKVTWSVQEGASGGSISAAGLYLAPEAAGTFHVVATASGTGATGEATVEVVLPTLSVSLTPSAIYLAPNASYTFAAVVSGSSGNSVSWSVREGTQGGSITSAGVYTAPSTAGTYHVVATSVLDPTKMDTATVTVSGAPVVVVAVNPKTASLWEGANASFTATVTGSSNGEVTWSVEEGATGGSVTSAGVYTAPSTAGTYHVVATSAADGTTTGVASVSVSSACLGTDLLASLGKTDIMVGFSDVDAVAAEAAWDLRYQYLAGPIGDGAPCSSSNESWWGCWQDWSQPPGQFVTGFIGTALANREIPMFTYYIILPASGSSEGAGEVSAASDSTFMAQYFGDWRFLLKTIGASEVLLHIEPDFWGYAQQTNSNPHAVPAAVASANPTDCGSEENSIAGMGQCMVSMVRKYAPNAKVGLHASAWATGVDVKLNTDPSLDVAGEAAKVGNFLSACGASQGDFVVVEASDRDAGYYASVGRKTWWDATNTTLPSFHQALAFDQALSEAIGKPALYWQVPVGNMEEDNTPDHWQDNRVQYFFDHPGEYVTAHVAGIAFGSGADGQTTPSSDGGYLVSRTTLYLAGGATPACP